MRGAFSFTASQNPVRFSLRNKVKEVLASDILKSMEQDLVDPVSTSVAYSQKDVQFLPILEKGISFKDGTFAQ